MLLKITFFLLHQASLGCERILGSSLSGKLGSQDIWIGWIDQGLSGNFKYISQKSGTSCNCNFI